MHLEDIYSAHPNINPHIFDSDEFLIIIGPVPAPPAVFLYWRLLPALLLESLERFLEVTGDKMLKLLNYDCAVHTQIQRQPMHRVSEPKLNVQNGQNHG